MSRVLAGPACTQLFGDHGADVIKVERPGCGDDTCAGESTYFLSVNRNKRSIAVNIQSDGGRSVIRDLVAISDVLVENFVPGKLDSLGLGYRVISALNPRLVYASMSGYGATGPDSHLAGYDVTVAAAAGLMSITGPDGGEPVKVGVAMTDVLTGTHLFGAVCAALLARHRTGRGQHIETSLLEAQLSALVNIGSGVLNSTNRPRRRGTAHESIVPYQAFSASDADLIVAAMNDEQFRSLCAVMVLEHLPLLPKFATNPDRVEHRAELIGVLAARFATRTRQEWLGALNAVGIAVAPVNTVREALDSPQARHREMVCAMDHPTAGRIQLLGHPVKFSETPPSMRRPPPLLGEHTDEVLGELLGYDRAKLAELRAGKHIA